MKIILSFLGALFFSIILSIDILPSASALDKAGTTVAAKIAPGVAVDSGVTTLNTPPSLLVREFAGDRRRLQSLDLAMDPAMLAKGRYVYFDLPAARSLKVGDTFNIVLATHGHPYLATVRNAARQEGIVILSGELAGNEQELPGEFSLSVDPDGGYAAGNFSTPATNFSLQARHDIAWIIDNNAIDHREGICFTRSKSELYCE
ncbi:hypothetical protein [Sodalis sp. RH23]|uniref:hypothetical protein n=1 Tax=unclassified Sodalis (in: enterobacteria) TaxID=2636512 RepID=UPI0039B60E98